MQLSDTKINFYGDQVAWDRAGAIAALVSRKDFIALGLSVVAAEILFTPGWRTALATCAVNVGLILIERLKENHLFMDNALRKSLKSRCIETKPDKNVPPTLDKWGLPAKLMRNNFVEYLFIAAAVPVSDHWLQKPVMLPYIAVIYPVLLTRVIQGFYRWNKVAKGDWIIEDKGPPPEPVKKPQRNFRLVPARLAVRGTPLALSAPKL